MLFQEQFENKIVLSVKVIKINTEKNFNWYINNKNVYFCIGQPYVR